MPSLAACLSGKNIYLIPPKKRRRRPRTPKFKPGVDDGPVGSPSNYSDHTIDDVSDSDEERRRRDPNRELVHIPPEFFKRNLSQCTSLTKPRKSSTGRSPAVKQDWLAVKRRKMKRQVLDGGGGDSSSEHDFDELFNYNLLGQKVSSGKKKKKSGDTVPTAVRRSSQSAALKHFQTSESTSATDAVSSLFTPGSKRSRPSVSTASCTATSTSSATTISTSSPVRKENKSAKRTESDPLSPILRFNLSDSDDCVDVTPIKQVATAISRVTSSSASVRRIDSKSRSGKRNEAGLKRETKAKAVKHSSTTAGSGRSSLIRSGRTANGSIEKYLVKRPAISSLAQVMSD